MTKILITGGKGRLAAILKKNLNEYDLTFIDLPEFDLTDYDKIIKELSNFDAIIHLAWDSRGENWKNNGINTDNILMAHNIYKFVINQKIPKVIMMSSIHANNYFDKHDQKLITINDEDIPDSPYGASKIFIEKLGQYYSQKYEINVICPRIGGVNLSNSPLEYPDEKYYSQIWLNQIDFCNLIRKCIENIDNKFCKFYAVSNNNNRLHDTSNPIGWLPI